jgi:putative transposase
VQLYSAYSISYCCSLFGKSRQAYYEQKDRDRDKGFEDGLVLKLVAELRKELPRCGTGKLHFMLQDAFTAHGIKLGRDGLYLLLGQYGLLIRQRKRRPYTTDSNHHYRKYPNLIRNKTLNHAGQLWVSDITYIRTTRGFCYLSIITDAYSHKIVGYKLHPNLKAEGATDALIMASADVKRTAELIHHSDRGIQYCCSDYVQMAEHYGIQLSMTENGDPYENAIAERINGILKQEHGLYETFSGEETAAKAVDEAIRKYNELRIHDSCGRLTPVAAHEQQGNLKKYWYQKKYNSHQTQEQHDAYP